MHVCTRTSTQARSHAQKFFVKIEKKNLTLDEFLRDLDLSNINQDMMWSDYEDEDNYNDDEKSLTSAQVKPEINDDDEEAQFKISKIPRKKSIMSYGLQQEEMDES